MNKLRNVVAAQVPVGHEDETGFHFGVKNGQVPESDQNASAPSWGQNRSEDAVAELPGHDASVRLWIESRLYKKALQ